MWDEVFKGLFTPGGLGINTPLRKLITKPGEIRMTASTPITFDVFTLRRLVLSLDDFEVAQ